MKHELIFHDDYLEIRACGKASLQGFLNYLLEGLERPEWRPSMNVLTDLTELEGHDTDAFDFSDTSAFASFVARNIERIGNAKCATIPGNYFDSKVLVSLYDSLTKYHGIPLRHRLVNDHTEALNWFGKD